MKNKKQNFIIIGVIAFVLALATGYALFSDEITVSGTATAKGSFDVEFTSVGTIVKNGYTDETGKDGANIAVISSDKNTLTVTVNKLSYPGAYVEIPVTVKNVGTIPAVLKEIVQTGLDADSTPIRVTYSGIAASDATVAPGTPATMTIKVEWLSTVNTTAEAASFTVKLDYEQAQVQ